MNSKVKISAEFVVKYTSCRFCINMIDLHSVFMSIFFKYVFLNHKGLKAKNCISHNALRWGFWMSIKFTNNMHSCKICKATAVFLTQGWKGDLDKLPLNFHKKSMNEHHNVENGCCCHHSTYIVMWLTHLLKLHLQISSHWGLGFQHTNFVETQIFKLLWLYWVNSHRNSNDWLMFQLWILPVNNSKRILSVLKKKQQKDIENPKHSKTELLHLKKNSSKVLSHENQKDKAFIGLVCP